MRLGEVQVRFILDIGSRAKFGVRVCVEAARQLAACERRMSSEARGQ